jgi:hypothetical protein
LSCFLLDSTLVTTSGRPKSISQSVESRVQQMMLVGAQMVAVVAGLEMDLVLLRLTAILRIMILVLCESVLLPDDLQMC